jgi:hypothetical protein
MGSLPQERHSLDLQQVLAGVDTLAPEDLPRLLGQLREVEAAAMARLYAKPSNSAAIEQEQLLDVEAAAKRLNVSEDYLYRNWKKFPFAHKYDWGLRFSARAIDVYISEKGMSLYTTRNKRAGGDR